MLPADDKICLRLEQPESGSTKSDIKLSVMNVFLIIILPFLYYETFALIRGLIMMLLIIAPNIICNYAVLLNQKSKPCALSFVSKSITSSQKSRDCSQPISSSKSKR